MVQRGHHFAIVDEVDSILIDEARTPLIISGPTEDRSDFYRTIDLLVKQMIKDPATFEHDEKQKQALLTEFGSETIEETLQQAGSPRRRLGRPLRSSQHLRRPPRQPGAARQRALSEREGLHRPRRRGDADRRVHRPHDARPPAVRRPAPGHRGQGGRRHPAREPDPGLGDYPELLPPLRQAQRHDRHGGDRGAGIPRHLQDGRLRDPDQPAGDTQGRRRRGLSHRRREERRHHQADRGLPPPRPADPGRHGLDREVGAPVRPAQGP